MRAVMPWIGLVLREVGFSKTLAREALANWIWVVLDPGGCILPGSADPVVGGVIPREQGKPALGGRCWFGWHSEVFVHEGLGFLHGFEGLVDGIFHTPGCCLHLFKGVADACVTWGVSFLDPLLAAKVLI